MSLRKRFLYIFTCISVIPIILISTYVYYRYTVLINEQSMSVLDNIGSNAQYKINQRLSEINDMTSTFQLYTENTYSIIDDLKKYEKEGNYTYYDIVKSRNNMRFTCQNIIYTNDFVNGIFIFTPSGVNLGYGWGNNIDIKYEYEPFEDKWYKDAVALKGKLYISDNSTKNFILNADRSISFARALYDVNTHDFLGVLFIDCSPDVFELDSINTLSDIAVLSVVDGNNNLLYTTDNSSDEKTIVNQKSSKQQYVLELPAKKYNLKIKLSLPLSELTARYNYTKVTLIILVIVCTVVLAIISYILSVYLTKPITALSDRMGDKSKKGPITSRKYLNRVDEVGVLYNEYNNMIIEINRYIKEEFQNKLILLDTQMKSLEAQINSHFLYNTLEAINSIAEIENVESISTIALALGDMFRYSIKTESELVTLAEELQHVKNYVSIQEIRYNYSFTVSYEIEEHLYQTRILKLIIQPVVENALFHGLNHCVIEGNIHIKVHEENENICISITDNGLGMSPEQVEQIRTALAKPTSFTSLGHRTKESIGLKNIHSRIQLYYGAQYGLTISSAEQIGTSITVNLPIIKEGV